MQTMMLSFARQQDSTAAPPSFFQAPGAPDDDVSITEESTSDESEGPDFPDAVHEPGAPDDEGPLRGIAKVVGNPCGQLPSDADALQQLMLCEDMLKGTGREALYCRLPHTTWKNSAVGLIPSSSLVARVAEAGFDACALAHFDIEQWHSDQTAYFAKLNKYESDPTVVEDPLEDDPHDVPAASADPHCVTSPAKLWKQNLDTCREAMDVALSKVTSSPTAVLEAAISALHRGLFTVPGSDGDWNSRQCLGFLLHAWQLQQNLNTTASNSEDGAVPVADAKDFSKCTIVTGAAGTGKTALLEAQDMLTDAAFGEANCVYRSAPTITAARLNRGDTCHAAWSLPFSSCLGPSCSGTNGRLTNASLRRLQKRLKGKREASIDEISMLSPERLFQIDHRAAEATGLSSFFGNLLVRLSGDFLQLPPVRSSTLASSTAPPRASTSKNDHESGDSSGDDATSEERKQGLAKWNQIQNVVCLTRVVRAPNALGALCTHVRHCNITDDVWALLKSRELRPNDARLQSPLWARHPLKVIVQRHLLRVSMSNAATLENAKKNVLSGVRRCSQRRC